MENGIILNLVENFWDVLRRPGFALLVVLRRTFGVGNFRDIVPSFCCFKAKSKNVIALFYRAQSRNLRSTFAITFASTTWFLKKIVNEAVNSAARNRAHDPITEIRVYVSFQILTIAVVGLGWEVPFPCIDRQKALHEVSVGLAHIVFSFDGRRLDNNCCIFCGDFLSCFLNGLFAAILSSLMSNIRCPILSLEIVDVGFALYRLQLRGIGFPLLFTFSVNRLIGVDDVVRCSANSICCHNGSFLVRCSMADPTHWTKNQKTLYECAGTASQAEWP